jgi:hypothetical protein
MRGDGKRPTARSIKGAVSPVEQGIRSPMNGYEQQRTFRMPSIGMTETMKGTAPKHAAKLSSPNPTGRPKM